MILVVQPLCKWWWHTARPPKTPKHTNYDDRAFNDIDSRPNAARVKAAFSSRLKIFTENR